MALPVKVAQKKILDELAKLGGSLAGEDDISFEGTQFVIPETMTLKQAIDALVERRSSEEEVTTFRKTFRYRPWDGAYVAFQVMKELFGMVSGKTLKTFFGDKPPDMISIPISSSESAQVPWGAMQIPMLPNSTIHFSSVDDNEMGPLFWMAVQAPRKYRAQIHGLFSAIEERLAVASMYRGKAIDGKEQADFLDLSGVDPAKVVYTDNVSHQLEASIWSLLRYSTEHRMLGIPLKRAVLIEGPYGTGKTLAAYLTARIAVHHGWTFLFARPGRDDLTQAMQTARLYQPAVVFFEDMDQVASPHEESDAMTRILDLFDGITAKGTEILAILTTNHPERIHKGMVRPGRLDAVIHVGELDDAGVVNMVRALVPPHLLSVDVDFAAVTKAMDGFLPAFVKEAIDRTMRYALARTHGQTDNMTLDTEDFVLAATGLRPQLELMAEASDTQPRDPLTTLHTRVVAETVEEVINRRINDNFLVG